MPLSDEERKRLRELEERLAEEDPDLAHKLQDGGPLKRIGPREASGLLAIMAGFGLIIAGISLQVTFLGVMGFLTAGTGAYLFFSGWSTRRFP